MTRRRCLAIIGVSATALLNTTIPNIGYSVGGFGDVVFDPANYGQALLQVKQAYDSYAQDLKRYATQLYQYKEQLTHTVQGAQNLLSTPLNIVADLDDLYKRYQTTMDAANAISMRASQVKAQFTALYNGQGGMTSSALIAKIRQMAQQQRLADQEAARMQALRERSDTTQAEMRRALEAVSTAKGNLQVQQAQGQLTGVLATQQQQFMEMMAASQRAATSYQAQQQTLQEIVQADAQEAMADWKNCPSCGTALKAFPSFR